MEYTEELKNALANLTDAPIKEENWSQKEEEWKVLKKLQQDMKFSEVDEKLQKAVNGALQGWGIGLSST